MLTDFKKKLAEYQIYAMCILQTNVMCFISKV